MFYKIVVNNIPKLFNISKAKRIELVHNKIYLIYKYTDTAGGMLMFWTELKEDFDVIKCSSNEEAQNHFESIEKLLK
jgi:hypothetical protein